jgi:hypothetical protein
VVGQALTGVDAFRWAGNVGALASVPIHAVVLLLAWTRQGRSRGRSPRGLLPDNLAAFASQQAARIKGKADM